MSECHWAIDCVLLLFSVYVSLDDIIFHRRRLLLFHLVFPSHQFRNTTACGQMNSLERRNDTHTHRFGLYDCRIKRFYSPKLHCFSFFSHIIIIDGIRFRFNMSSGQIRFHSVMNNFSVSWSQSHFSLFIHSSSFSSDASRSIYSNLKSKKRFLCLFLIFFFFFE